MRELRTKAQALTLVLIVVVVSIIIAFSITSRVVEDIKQQGEEKASTRAEAFAESAVENLTQKIQTGELVPTANKDTVKYAVSTQSPQTQTVDGNLGICDPNSNDVSKQCDQNSVAQVTYYNMIVQFKVFNSENIEVQMTDLQTTTPVKSDASKMLVHLRTTGNTTFDVNNSKLLVKGFARVATASGNEVKVVSECVVNLKSLETSQCLPEKHLHVSAIECPQVGIKTAGATGTVTGTLGDKCFVVQNQAGFGNGVSFYRIKPLLSATNSTTVPYIDISTTGIANPVSPNPTQVTLDPYELPVPQMAVINAGVYSGTSSNDQQVFQQSTRLILLNKAVPEIADYVLYNGSSNPIVKQ